MAVVIDGTNGITTAGNITMSSSNGGITFNKSGGLNNALLNDYETGTFTPTLLINGSPGTGVTYGSQLGAYTKVGNVVTATVFIALTSKGSTSGSFTMIGNFPFATPASPAYLQAGTIGYTVNFTTLAPNCGYNDNGTSYFVLYNSAAVAWVGTTNLQNTSNFSFSVTYIAA